MLQIADSRYIAIIVGIRPEIVKLAPLVRLRHDVKLLLMHFSPHSVESGVRSDLATIATVFSDVFLPAGTG